MILEWCYLISQKLINFVKKSPYRVKMYLNHARSFNKYIQLEGK